MRGKYFSEEELQCHGEGCCGHENKTTQELIELLDRMREYIGGPLEISCAYRCSTHNANVGGVQNSAHRYGMAADVQLPSGYTVEMLADVARACGAEGILKYGSSLFVHVSMGAGEGEYWMD